MNNATHTPGPWKWEEGKLYDEQDRFLCTSFDELGEEGMPPDSDNCHYAALIAAAPAIYADAKQLCELVRDFMNDNRLYDGQVIQAISNLETALSQAEGRQS